jgi:hypothetical protein
LDELFGVKTSVGDVAASAAGDTNFVQGVTAGFEDGDIEVGVMGGGGNGPEETGGPTANDDDALHVKL